eukprot:2445813-Prorocentrum_lima.AAC.1
MLPRVALAGGEGLRLVPGHALEGGRWRRRAGWWRRGGRGASEVGDRIRLFGLAGGRVGGGRWPLWCDGVLDSMVGGRL